MKKTLSIILAVLLIVSAAPLTGAEAAKITAFADLFGGFSVKAYASDYRSGNYSYSLSDEDATVTITKYNSTALNVISVPSSIDGYPVVAIGDNAFEGTNVCAVSVPEGVKTIGHSAFRECAYLASVELPSTLETICSGCDWEGAFNHCTRLNSVTIRDGEKELTIANDVFRDCTALRSITLPGRCVSIGGSCFVGCSALESFTLGKNAYGTTQTIGGEIFKECKSLKNVTLPDTLEEIPDGAFYKTAIASFTVQEGVKTIGRSAFGECAYLTSVTLPSTLETICSGCEWEGAFNHCTRLNSVTIRDGEKDLTVENNTFRDCSALQSITLPGRCVSIGGSCFVGCSALESFTLGKNAYGTTQTIGGEIFKECNNLKNVTLPDTLEEIPDGAFCETAITSFAVQEGVKTIGKYAFKSCAYLTSVTLPSTLETICSGCEWDGAFNNCTNLSSVTIRDGEKDLTIDHNTFRDCSALRSITLPGRCVSIGESCFVGCSALESFTLGKNAYGTTQTIGGEIFKECSNFKNVTLPDTLKEIPDGAFYETAIASFTVPEGVRTIGKYAFKSCAYLTSVTLPSTLETICSGCEWDGAFNNCVNLTSVIIRDGEKHLTIEHDTFRDCTSLTEIHIPANTISIGENAFYGHPDTLVICSGSSTGVAKTYALQNGITFRNCANNHNNQQSFTVTFDANGGSVSPSSETVTAGTAVTLPMPTKSYKIIYKANGDDTTLTPTAKTVYCTFRNWNTMPAGGGTSCSAGASFTVTADATLYAQWTDPTAGTLATPTREGFTFEGWFTSASGGDHVTSETTITANTTVYAHWKSVPVNPSGLCGQSVFWELDKSTGELFVFGTGEMYDFGGSSDAPWYADRREIRTVTIQNGVTSIGCGAFEACENLTSATIWNSVTMIGAYAFYCCNSLTQVTIPGSVTEIGEYAFAECAALAGVKILNGVTDIGEGAFFNTVLTQVQIPCSVRTIGDGAFICRAADASGSVGLPTLQQITADAANDSFSSRDGVLYNKDQTTLLVYPAGNPRTSFTVPDTVTSIATCAFQASANLSEITVPVCVSAVEACAFEDCIALKDVYYEGTGAQWNAIRIEDGNESLLGAELHTITDAHLILSSQKAKAGSRVDVTLTVENNPGIIAAYVNLTYDRTKLKLVGVQDGGLLGKNTFYPGNDLLAVPYTVMWEDALSSQNYIGNGILATFTFEVRQDAEPGETPVTLQYSKKSTFNVDVHEVEFALTGGSVEIVRRIPGDVNGDGDINLQDVVILRRFLMGGWNVTIDESNSDVNADQTVDLKDVVFLRRFLSGGWNVTLI